MLTMLVVMLCTVTLTNTGGIRLSNCEIALYDLLPNFANCQFAARKIVRGKVGITATCLPMRLKGEPT